MKNQKYAFNPNLTESDREKNRFFIIENLYWRNHIVRRDFFTCLVCKKKRETIIAHHIFSYHKYKDFRTSLANGMALCETCHKSFHKWYGNRNNHPLQFEEFRVNRAWEIFVESIN